MIMQITVPDIGDFKGVDVVEILVAVGERVALEAPLLTLETDKATMEVPAPYAGVIQEIKVAVGDKVAQGSLIMTLAVDVETVAPDSKPQTEAPLVPAPVTPAVVVPVAPAASPAEASPVVSGQEAHASPSIRRLARELGVDLAQVPGSGRKQRILKEDVQRFVQTALAAPPVSTPSSAPSSVAGLSLLPMPELDFSGFGSTQLQPLSRIKKLSGAILHRNWVNIPHVTQFDEVDITEMEAFRKSLAAETTAKDKGVRLTPLVFILKAVVAALKAFPTFNSSLDSRGENLILKQYYHIGVAVDTPNGLVVPVIRQVDQKSLLQLAQELAAISQKARDGKLLPGEMQGGCFTLSSLGGIGGTAFTPIINAPEVAILGVSRARLKPDYQNGEWVPRLYLPLSLSYDHRVIDGAEGARFITHLGLLLADVRRLLL